VVSTTTVACGEKPGCSKDTDCKGDRVCVRGECQAGTAETPKRTATPDPSKPSDMDRYADELCACSDQKCVDSTNKAWEDKLDGKLTDMSDKDKAAFSRALGCALKYVAK
jgi:hypothetical protein